jgi:hypothetical protein
MRFTKIVASSDFFMSEKTELLINVESFDKALLINFEFMWKAIVQAVDLLAKGTTYYFTIFVFITGFIFTAKISVELQLLLLCVVTVVSVLFAIIMLSFAYGVTKGLGQLELALKKHHRSAYSSLDMALFFKRGKIVGQTTTVACLLILFTIVGGLVFKFILRL